MRREFQSRSRNHPLGETSELSTTTSCRALTYFRVFCFWIRAFAVQQNAAPGLVHPVPLVVAVDACHHPRIRRIFVNWTSWPGPRSSASLAVAPASLQRSAAWRAAGCFMFPAGLCPPGKSRAPGPACQAVSSCCRCTWSPGRNRRSAGG